MGITYSGGFGKPPGYRYGATDAPVSTGGKVQPRSPHGPKLKKVTVRSHTRTIPPKPPKPTSDQALIQAATRLRFGPQEQGIQQQLNQNARFTSGVPVWYQNALAEIKNLQAGQQAQAAQTLQGIQSYNSQPSAGTPDAAQAANARNSLNSQYAASFGRDAQANSDFMARLAAAQTIAQGNTLNQANAERMGLLAGQTALKGQEGDFQTQYGAQLQAAKQKALGDAAKVDLAAKALGLKVDTYENVQKPLAQSLIGNRAQQQRVARTNARTQRRNAQTKAAGQALNVAKEAHRAYLDAHPNLKKGAKNGGRSAGETTAHHKIVRTVDNAVEDVTRGRGKNLKDDAIRGAMQLNKIPNDVIDAAFALADRRPLSAKQINRLRNAGLIAAPRRWKTGTPSLGQVVVKGLNKLASG